MELGLDLSGSPESALVPGVNRCALCSISYCCQFGGVAAFDGRRRGGKGSASASKPVLVCAVEKTFPIVVWFSSCGPFRILVM